MKKRILSLLITAVSILNLNFIVSAESIENDINKTEMNQAEEAIDKFSDEFSNITETGKIYSINGEEEMVRGLNLDGYDLSRAYKSYSIYGLMIDSYKENPSFSSLISDKYVVYLPSTYNMIALYPDENNVLEVGSTTSLDERTIYMTEEAEKVLPTIDEEIIEVKYANSYMYYFELIYVKTTENEYVIPYLHKPALFPHPLEGIIENGKIYDPEFFMRAMDNTYDIEKNNPEASGGVPTRDEAVAMELNNKLLMEFNAEKNSGNNYLIIFSIAAGALIVVLFAGAGIYRKIKKH